MKKNKSQKTSNTRNIGNHEIRFKSQTRKWTGKDNPTNQDIWTSYLKNDDNDMFGEWLPEVVDIFINTIDIKIQNMDSLINVFLTSIEFYLWTEKRKFLIEKVKNTPEKKRISFLNQAAIQEKMIIKQSALEITSLMGIHIF